MAKFYFDNKIKSKKQKKEKKCRYIIYIKSFYTGKPLTLQQIAYDILYAI